MFGDDAALAERIKSDFDCYGADDEVLARSLARDLMRIARAREA